jgi:hypothetical protein
MGKEQDIKMISKWFKTNRESYEWPPKTCRQKSEEIINSLCSKVCDAVRGKKLDELRSVLIEIHRWKTNNRQKQTQKYSATLKSKCSSYFEKLIQMAPFEDISKLRDLIMHLKVTNCNLPVCSAIASFFYCRKKVPIIDRFLAQFFSRKFKLNLINEDTSQVINSVKIINFKLERPGKDSNLRLAVYTDEGFKENLKIYLEEFIPECERIANLLTQSGTRYIDWHGNTTEFTPQDVEMAIFSWATKNSALFE